MKFIALAVLSILPFTSNNLSVDIKSSGVLHSISGASGIVSYKEHFYVIGDDSPYLHKLDKDFKVVDKFVIFNAEVGVEKIKKSLKPDFEAMELINENEILIFGSGSKSPERDLFLKISIEQPHKVISYKVTEFFDKLRALPALEGKLNIEAMAFHKNKLYLINRNTNAILTYPFDELMKYFDGKGTYPEPEVAVFKLPNIKGIEAGFSGATVLTKQGKLLFTASVENTDNAYDDGAILGSFVGVIDISGSTLPSTYDYTQLERAVKVESITVSKHISEKEIEVVLVTDSDGKESEYFRCNLSFL